MLVSRRDCIIPDLCIGRGIFQIPIAGLPSVLTCDTSVYLNLHFLDGKLMHCHSGFEMASISKRVGRRAPGAPCCNA